MNSPYLFAQRKHVSSREHDNHPANLFCLRETYFINVKRERESRLYLDEQR